MPATRDATKTVTKQTILGIDYGKKQIGFAVLSRPVDIVTPLTVIRCPNQKPDWPALEKLLIEWQPDTCVVGLPLHMDGTESEFSRRCRRFARQLEGRLASTLAFTVDLHDERLSSMEAKQMLADHGPDGGHSTKDYISRPADSLAAKVILESWLQKQLAGL